MLEILVHVAYQGHSAASATGGPLTLHTDQGSGTVRQDGTLDMDSAWAAWGRTWADVEAQGNTVPGLYVNPKSVAGTLWLWSRVLVTHQAGTLNILASVRSAASSMVNVIIEFLQLGLSRWAVERGEPCTATLLALQQGGRRTHPAILTRLMKMSHKSKAVRSWRDLGLKVETGVRTLNSRTGAQYIWALRKLVVGPEKRFWQPRKRLLKRPKDLPLASGKKRQLVSAEKRPRDDALLVELLWDSSHFASKDIQVNMVYCPVQELAAYAPPMSLRHLRWRASDAGDPVTEEDWETFDKSGFRVKSRMESFDCIKYCNHVMEVMFGKSLLSFACSKPLERMQASSVRIYHHGHKRWYRVGAEDRLNRQHSASDSGTGSAEVGLVELPNELLDPFSVHVLLATLDQKQSQWTAMHCCASPQGLNLMIAFRCDMFHRSWRDFQFTVTHAKGGFQHSSCQLNYALNVNYHLGFFLAKRGEIKKIGR